MNIFHSHEWQYPEGYKGHELTRPYGNQGFVRTIYFYIQKCSKCGEQRRRIYNDWIRDPKNDPDPEDQWAANHACIMVQGGLGYEKVSEVI
jgi:hypothetical protein